MLGRAGRGDAQGETATQRSQTEGALGCVSSPVTGSWWKGRLLLWGYSGAVEPLFAFFSIHGRVGQPIALSRISVTCRAIVTSLLARQRFPVKPVVAYSLQAVTGLLATT